MWLAYVDESFNDTYHYVAALLLEDDKVNAAQSSLRDVVVKAAGAYGIQEEAELHGYDVFHGVGGFAAMHGTPRARVAVYRDVCRALVAADCWLIFRGVHNSRLEARYVSAQHPQRVVMTHLIERIDSFCKVRGEKTLALIVADEHRETQRTLLRSLVVYQELGTWGYLGKRITRVIDTIHFVDSQTNRLVQGADMVSFIEFRHLVHEETDRRNESAIIMLHGSLEPRIFHRWCWHP